MEALADRLDVDRPLGLQPEVVDPHRRLVARRDPVGPLVGHGQAEALEHRQDVGQRHALAAAVELAAQDPGRRLERPVEAEVERVVALERLDPLHVRDRRAREEVIAVGGRERARAVAAHERRARLLAELLQQRLLQLVVPAASGLDDARLQLLAVVRRQLAGGHAQRVVDAHEHPIRQPQPPVDGLRVERLAQDLGDAHPVVRVEAIARQEHEAGHEALVAVGAHEQPHALALAQLEDPDRDRVQLVGLDLEQLVARERVHDLDERLVVMAAAREARPLAHGLDLAAQHGDVRGHLAVRGRREEAQEAVLADHVALVVEALDAHIVEVARAVDRGAGVGLGQDQHVRLARERPRGGRQLRVGRRDVAAGLAAQQAEARCPRRRAGCRRPACTRGSRGT